MLTKFDLVYEVWLILLHLYIEHNMLQIFLNSLQFSFVCLQSVQFVVQL